MFLKLLNIKKSNQKNKKYSADVLYNNKEYHNVNFGDIRYQQYKDSTPLKLYSNLDHNDENRRRLFYIRHKNNNGIASILSKKFLW